VVILGDVPVHHVYMLPILAARALPIVATALIVIGSVDDLVKSPALTLGQPVLACVLHVAIQIVLAALKRALRVETRIVFPGEEGHEQEVLFIGGLGVEEAWITGGRTKKALLLLRTGPNRERVEMEECPRTQQTDPFDGVT